MLLSLHRKKQSYVKITCLFLEIWGSKNYLNCSYLSQHFIQSHPTSICLQKRVRNRSVVRQNVTEDLEDFETLLD